MSFPQSMTITSIRTKMSLTSFLLNNDVDNNNNNNNTKNDDIFEAKPFLLYKGLNPDVEEKLKIFPLTNDIIYSDINNSEITSSVSSSPSPVSSIEIDKKYSILSSSPSISPTSSITSSNSPFNYTTIPIPGYNKLFLNTSNDELSFISSNSDSDENDDNELIKEIHLNDDNDNKRIRYKCNYHSCRYKGTFLSKDYLRRHIREQHRRSKEHVCMGFSINGEKWGCNKKFSRPYQLVNHWRGQRSLKRCGVPEEELRRRGIL